VRERERRTVIRRIQEAALLFVMAGICSACGASRPVKYYVLDSGPAPANASSTQLPITLLVARITAPLLYRDDRLVYGTGSVQLGTYEYERWAESPAAMVQGMLVSSLRSTGQYRSVVPVSSSVRGDYVVRGHLYALDEVEKPELAGRFSLEIELFDPKSGTTVWTDSYLHDEPATGKAVTDVVEALDKNVHTGLQQLTSDLGQYFANHPSHLTAAQ
jgi:ABC-type uncharacterized transport system auxiliary subunit